MATTSKPARGADDDAAAGALERTASWFREMGDTYARIATNSVSPAMKTANAAEAAKYYGIAERMQPNLA